MLRYALAHSGNVMDRSRTSLEVDNVHAATSTQDLVLDIALELRRRDVLAARERVVDLDTLGLEQL